MERIGIHSVPRSGSSWVGTIFDSHPQVAYKFQPLFSYELKGFLNERADTAQIDAFFDRLKHSNDSFIHQIENKQLGHIPAFTKVNPINTLVYKEVRYHHIIENLLRQSETKIIGIVRNPMAVIDSWLRAPKEFNRKDGWKELEEWRFATKKNQDKPEEFNGFEKWIEVTNLFEKLQLLFPTRFLLVRYDDLLSNTLAQVDRMFAFSGLEMTEQTKNFLSLSTSIDKSEDAYSIFRKKANDTNWKNSLHPQIIREIEQRLSGNSLEKYLAAE